MLLRLDSWRSRLTAHTHTHVYLEEEETQTSIRNRKKESSLLSFFFVHRQPATAGAALER